MSKELILPSGANPLKRQADNLLKVVEQSPSTVMIKLGDQPKEIYLTFLFYFAG
jgi:hypothetical protein